MSTAKVNGDAKSWPFPNPQVVREEYLPKLAIKPWVSEYPADRILKNCQVVDPASGKLLQGLKSVTISEGKIQSITDSDSTQSTSNVIDLEGAYLCPGLIDGHVHITATPGVKTMLEVVKLPEQVTSLRATYVLKEMLARGFTTVRDTGGASKVIANALAEGLLQGPRLVQCGKALSQTGGHADFSSAVSGGNQTGCCGGHSEALGRVCDGVPQVLKAVREELKAGADFIKIMMGGGVSSEADPIDMIQFTEEEVQAITKTCTRMGNKLTTAHAYTPEAIRHAVENGVRCIEHGNFLDVPTAKMMAEKGIFLTPTLACYGIMARKPFEDFLSENGKPKNLEVMKQGLQALQIAEEAGVTVCYGSDLLVSMHALQTEEFSVRSQVLDSPTVLRQATTNAAKLCQQEGKIGVIAPGAYADLIVLRSNPLEDITILDHPEDHLLAVIKDGRVATSQIKGL
ncbi:uncharacterized protein IL334_000244 [Kwoniella shivajii]|uniref:Amidohydrolase-related domain-containing protein n=1 Tax=Kwoniella shivajii TaxID=564305 RepID=A0ABZ1CNL3_9TREE|nr:hypothetical protein IL334_000244 [Kwoniella shivajii]